MKHVLDIRVYYEDTDAGGVVYHANYLKFAERARTEFLRMTGFQNPVLAQDFEIIFVVRHIEIDYLKPVLLDDSLRVETSVAAIKNSSFVMKQLIFRQNSAKSDDFVCDIGVTLVCVDTKDFRAVRLPEQVKTEFLKYCVEGSES